MALSVGDEAATRDLSARHGLQFPVGHSAGAAVTGAFVNPGPPLLQPAGFVLDPGGRMIVGVYSSGASGRLLPQDVIGLVRYPADTRPSASPDARHGTPRTRRLSRCSYPRP